MAAGLIHGARVSLAIGFVAMAAAVLIGVTLGAVAGYFGGWMDLLVSRLFEFMLVFPTFFLLLTHCRDHQKTQHFLYHAGDRLHQLGEPGTADTQ